MQLFSLLLPGKVEGCRRLLRACSASAILFLSAAVAKAQDASFTGIASIGLSRPDQPASNATEEAYHQIQQDGLSKLIDETVDSSSFRDLGGGLRWQAKFMQNNTRYIQFWFDRIDSPPGAKYAIRVVDAAETELARYEAQQFGAHDTFVTSLLPPGNLRIQLQANIIPQGLSFHLKSASWQQRSTAAKAQSVVVKVQYFRTLPVNDPIRSVQSSVAMLHIGELETACTAVLVGPTTLATNYHCIKYSLAFLKSEQTQPSDCHDVVAEFDYFVAGQRGRTVKCLTARANRDLDVAFLTFDANELRMASGEARHPVDLRPATESPPTKVHLVHHPLGLPLAVVVDCSVAGQEGIDLLHDCQSLEGSSGSPLFDERLRWAGLHYKAAYPSDWTIEQIENDFVQNGPRYNRARGSAAVLNFLAQ